jgi:hypothetical protein
MLKIKYENFKIVTFFSSLLIIRTFQNNFTFEFFFKIYFFVVKNFEKKNYM